MGKCKDCKWWGSESVVADLMNDVLFQFRVCENPHFVYGNSPEDKSKPLTIVDCVYGIKDDGYSDIPINGGGVITGPDFGCIHHEPKEKKNG